MRHELQAPAFCVVRVRRRDRPEGAQCLVGLAGPGWASPWVEGPAVVAPAGLVCGWDQAPPFGERGTQGVGRGASWLCVGVFAQVQTLPPTARALPNPKEKGLVWW